MEQNTKEHCSASDAEGKVKKYVEKFRHEEGCLIMILHAIQNDEGYVPREWALALSPMLGIPVARIYEVLTFYHFFKLKPQGKHNIVICMGTACYLKGGADILKGVEEYLGIKSGETTEDRLFHIDVARCIGACGLAPAVKIDDDVIGKATIEKVIAHIEQIKSQEA